MRRAVILTAATVSAAAVLTSYVLLRGHPADGEPYDPPTASRQDLVAVSNARVFFAHQSVGGNILDGVPTVFQAHDLPAPVVTELSDATPGDLFLHQRVGENGDPLGKIEEFDTIVRSGLGADLDVAVLKLCYSDVRDTTDVNEVFDAYTQTFADLQRDYPDVAFVAATVPLSTERDAKGKLKEWLGRGDRHGPEHNVARERLNALLRSEYADADRLFDVAALESTAPDGGRVAARYGDDLYYSLDRGYASDHGHLNPSGAAHVADGFMSVVGRSLGN